MRNAPRPKGVRGESGSEPAVTYSPTTEAAVPSALRGLTTGFGMGPGVTPSREPPARVLGWMDLRRGAQGCIVRLESDSSNSLSEPEQ